MRDPSTRCGGPSLLLRRLRLRVLHPDVPRGSSGASPAPQTPPIPPTPLGVKLSPKLSPPLGEGPGFIPCLVSCPSTDLWGRQVFRVVPEMPRMGSLPQEVSPGPYAGSLNSRLSREEGTVRVCGSLTWANSQAGAWTTIRVTTVAATLNSITVTSSTSPSPITITVTAIIISASFQALVQDPSLLLASPPQCDAPVPPRTWVRSPFSSSPRRRVLSLHISTQRLLKAI